MAVMAAVVLNRKMPVAAQRAVEQSQLAAQPVLLVAQLVAQVQTKPQHRSGHQHRGQPSGPGHRVGREKHQVEQHRRPQHGNSRVQNATVVAVGLQRGHLRLGRVGQVFADQPVDQRDHQVKQDQRQGKPPRAGGAQRVRQRAGGGDAGAHDRQQPAPALAVPVSARRSGV